MFKLSFSLKIADLSCSIPLKINKYVIIKHNFQMDSQTSDYLISHHNPQHALNMFKPVK